MPLSSNVIRRKKGESAIYKYIVILLLYSFSSTSFAGDKGAVKWHLDDLLQGNKPFSFVVFEDSKSKKFVQFIRDSDGTIRGDLPPGAIKGYELRARFFLMFYSVFSKTEILTGDGKTTYSFVIPFHTNTDAATRFTNNVFTYIHWLDEVSVVAYDQ